MLTLALQNTIGPGSDKQVATLFAGPGRRLVQITLRQRARLAAHTSPVPITIQCVAGAGTLTSTTLATAVALRPGTLVTLEAGEMHEVNAAPEVSILLTQFTASE